MKKQLLLIILLLYGMSAIAQNPKTRQITGKVVEAETSLPIPGVSIVIKGTNIGTTTDTEGKYSIKVPDESGQELVFSFIGYVTQSIIVGSQSEINISLQSDITQLNEVVIIGYGQIKKRDVTGAIVSMKTEDLTKIPTTNVMESLQGRIAGVDITRNSGQAGAGISVTVRGNRSITASNNPLYIVDGIQYSTIQDLNPNDIESMEILKDASTTAIYGSRGANGVVIITTKKGAADKVTVSLNSYFGISQIDYPRMKNAQEYVAMKREANRAAGRWASEADDSKIFSEFERQQIQANANTDWINLFLRNGVQQDYQVGVRGGNAKTRYYTSLNYFREDGVFNMDNLSRYNGRVNLDFSATEKIKLGTQMQLTHYNQNIRRDPLNNAAKLNPLLLPYDKDGKVIFQPDGRTVNPLVDEQPNNYVNNVRTTRIFSSVYVDAQLTSDLNFRSNFGATFDYRRTGIFRGSETVDRVGSVSQAVYNTSQDIRLTWENIITYQKKFGAHDITATGITTLLTNRDESQSATGANQLLNSQLFYALGNATEQVSIASTYAGSNLVSFTGRVQYSLKGKYILSFTGRSDGSSKLVDKNKWAFFPSIAGAWHIIDEPFMKNQNVFSELKVRGSYGIAGNDAVAPYSSQSLLRRIPFSFGETPAVGNRFDLRIGNEDLRWELSTTYNGGIDFGLFRNRLTGSIDLYDTRTKDLLLNRTLPPTSGAGIITENIGKTRNRGVELSLSARAIDKNGFQWNVGVNWFRNREEIVELATGANDLVNSWFVGYPTVAYYDYEKLGIWQTSEADRAAKFNQKPGDIKVKDQNNDGKIDPINDRIVLGSPRPSWSTNLNNDIRFKGFDFSVQFFARIGQMMPYAYNTIHDPQGIENGSFQNYWTPENPSNDYPRPDASKSQSATLYFSTLQYVDASFVKLRGLTLGYSLPSTVLGKMGLARARFYITGRNVLIFAKTPNYDPERGGSMSNPIPRLWVAGLNIDF
jgi:TonB-linked SusC/RagA family outer membrane protein